MYILAHTGIGGFLAKPFSRGLPKKYLYIGALLPDIVDKILYYGLRWFDGNSWIYTDIIRGTRSFGHTLLFLVIGLVLVTPFKNRKMLLLMFGVATHLLLDQVDEALMTHTQEFDFQSFTTVLFWPFQGASFPTYKFSGVTDHIGKVGDPMHLATEVIGSILLIWEYRRFIGIEKVLKRKQK